MAVSDDCIFPFQHHCRKCGKVVCNDCSSKRWMLPQQSSKPLRVCLTCYEKLSSARTPSVSGKNFFSIKGGHNFLTSPFDIC